MGSEVNTVGDLIQEKLEDETLFFDSIVLIQYSDGSAITMAKAYEILEEDAPYLDYEVLAEDKDDDDVFIIICEKADEDEDDNEDMSADEDADSDIDSENDFDDSYNPDAALDDDEDIEAPSALAQ